MSPRILAASLLALASAASTGHAEPSSLIAFDAPTRALLASADAARGKETAADSKCNKCHGADGISQDPEDPSLAGQRASYTFKELMDYRSKHRDNRDMFKRVRSLDDRQLADMAAWYASLPLPPSAKAAEASAATRRLVFKGDPKRMLKPCASCHGRGGEGSQRDSAAITGLRRSYFVATMQAFKTDDRTNDIYSRMRVIAAALTDEEIEGLADYYAMTNAEK